MSAETARRASFQRRFESSLSDDEFERLLDDPSLIDTRGIVREISREIEDNIAGITTQIEEYTIFCLTATPSDEKRDWHRRASFARAHRNLELEALRRRDAELRGIQRRLNGHDDAAAKIAKAADNAAKQERLRAEAQARREKHQAEAIAQQLQLQTNAHRHSVHRQFVKIAKDMIEPAMFDLIMDEAEQRCAIVKGEA